MRRLEELEYYLSAVHPSAKNYILTCVGCGTTGHAPSIVAPGFDDDPARAFMKRVLTRHLEILVLNDSGLCSDCAARIAPPDQS